MILRVIGNLRLRFKQYSKLQAPTIVQRRWHQIFTKPNLKLLHNIPMHGEIKQAWHSVHTTLQKFQNAAYFYGFAYRLH